MHDACGFVHLGHVVRPISVEYDIQEEGKKGAVEVKIRAPRILLPSPEGEVWGAGVLTGPFQENLPVYRVLTPL